MPLKGEGRAIVSYGLFAMTLTHSLTHVFQRIHLALFPVIREEFKLSIQQLGVVASIPPLCQALLTVPAGLLSDRFGSKGVILLSLSAAAAGSLLASRSWSPLMLIMAVSLAYVNTSLYHPAAYSFTTSIFDPRDRPKALGIHGAGGTLGIAIGPLSVGLLMGLLSLDWRGIYLFWFFPLLIGIILLIPLKGEIEIEEEEVRIEEGRTIFTLSLLLFLSFLAMRMMGSQMVAAFLTLYLVDVRGLSQTWASLIYGFNPLVGLIAAPIGGFLAARFGEKRWLLCVLAISYTSLGLALISPHILPFALLYIAYGFFNYLGMAANSAIMARLSPRGRRGLGFGLYFLPIYIVGAIAPLLAAKLASLYGLQMIFPLALTLLALCLLILKLGVKM